MCGLFFAARRGAPIDRARFEAAFATVSHRGPDATVYSYGVAEIATADGTMPLHWAAGHHRLAILDLDPRSNQPFERDGALLVYNGEAYDYERLKREPTLRDVAFETSGDTEVLFEGLRRAGPKFVDDINGMWAFVFADWNAGVVHASRDRFGKKPLFWRLDADTFCAGSTMGVIDRFLGRKTRFDHEALTRFVAHGASFPGGDETTPHADIRQVPPSATLTLDLAAWEASTRSFFSFEQPAPADPDATLAEILADSLRLRLVSDRPVGLLLSGGIDSSLLLSIAHAGGLTDQLRCFIGETGKSEDADYARRCIAELGIEADEVQLGYDASSFDRFIRMCRHQEKPFPIVGNAMAMAEMYEGVSAYGIPVVLDGTGGDELFGGYWKRYLPFAARDAWARKDVRWLDETAAADPTHLGIIEAALKPAAPRPAEAALAACARFDIGAATSSDPLSDPGLGFEQAMRIDASRGRLGEWLWQNDRNAMMASIENRSPLLDYRLTAFIATGYAQMFSGAWNKIALRKAFDAFRTLPTQWRVQKQGFRWDRRAFLNNNRKAVIMLLAGSPLVDTLVDRTRFIDAIRTDRMALRSETTMRLLAIAGVDQAMNA